jgi:hypothetical protein
MKIQEIYFTERRMQQWCDDLLDGVHAFGAPVKYNGVYAGHEFTAYYTMRDRRTAATKEYPYRYTFMGRRYFRLQDVRDAIRDRNARIGKIIEKAGVE